MQAMNLDDVEQQHRREEAQKRWAQEDPIKDMASRDARGQATEEEREYLRSSEGVEEWIDALGRITADVEAQFAERKAAASTYQNECMQAGETAKQNWFTYKAEYETWKGRTKRFKSSLVNRLSEAKALRRQLVPKDSFSGEREGRLTDAVIAALEFLKWDENITYAAVQDRDKLVEQLRRALGGSE